MKFQSRKLLFHPGMLAALSWLPLASVAGAEPRLTMSASTPEITVETRAPGRNFINLPSLEYEFVLDAGCDDGMAPGALMLSVADTTLILNETQIAETPTELTLRIPAEQIGPVALNRFCAVVPAESPAADASDESPNGTASGRSGDADPAGAADQPPRAGPAASAASKPVAPGPDTLLIRSVVSAQGSLMCRNEQGQKVVYASRSLDVLLNCNRAQDSESVPAGR